MPSVAIRFCLVDGLAQFAILFYTEKSGNLKDTINVIGICCASVKHASAMNGNLDPLVNIANRMKVLYWVIVTDKTV